MSEEKRPGPVGWLLAGALIRNAARIARAMIANELDLRDWMTHNPPIDLATGRTELWFDYIADTGDDWLAMRALAAEMAKPQTFGSHATPVGEFVFVGGDTAYHVADETTVRTRFVSPYQDAIEKADPKPPDRRLFGIPGNHDYYDNLVGFNRMFRKPLDGDTAVLAIDLHATHQEASYVRIDLPGGWELWAVDLGPHGLDYRQKRYFRGTLPIGKVPKKLILAVPTPPITFDHVRVEMGEKRKHDAEHQAYRRLFGVDGTPDEIQVDPKLVAKTLASGECRLHIGGDDHNYQRYGGRGEGDANPIPCAAAIVSGGGGAFLHPTETSLGDVKRAKTYPSLDDSRRATARSLINPLTIMRGGYVWLVGALLGVLFYATFPHAVAELGPPALYVAAIALGIGALYGAHKIGETIAKARKAEAKRHRDAQKQAPNKRQTVIARGNPRTFWPPAIMIALGLPFVARAVWPAVDPLAPASVFLVVAVLLVALLGWFGKGGNGNGEPHRKIGFAILGVLHAVIQVGMPVSLVLRGSAITFAALLGAWAVFVLVAPPLYRARHKWLLLALWILQGPAVVALAWLGIGEPLLDRSWWMLIPVAVAGAVVSVVQYGWYMLVASAFDGHNNEVGSANRITRFKQWIRFHVTAERLTGYVIAIPDPKNDPRPILVDVFHVEPKA